MSVQKFLSVELKKSDRDGRWVMSHSSPDRVDDTIDPKAYTKALKRISGNLIALFNHDATKIAGYWTNLKAESNRLTGDLKLADTNIGRMLKAALDSGVPIGSSIGFRGLEGEPNEKGGIHFTDLEILETSLVAVAAHPMAVQIAKSFGIPLSSEVEGMPRSGTSAHETRRLGDVLQFSKSGKTMNLSERIQATEKQLNELRDRAVEVTKAFDADDADMDTLNDELATVNEDISKVEKLLANLKTTERNISLRAAPVEKAAASAPGIAPKLAARKDPSNPADLFVKLAVGTLVAERDRINMDMALAKTYGDAHYINDINKVIRQKTAMDPTAAAGYQSPLTTYTPGAAQELVQEATRQWVDGIAVESLAARLGARCRQLNFNGRGSIKISNRAPTALTGLTEPAWVHEGRNIPIQGYGIGTKTIDRGKMASIIPFTEELLDSNLVTDLEAELRDAMTEAAAVVLDQTFFSAAAGVARVHPAGILNGAGTVTATTNGGIAAVTGDIQALYNAMTTARLGARPVLVANTTDLMAAGFMRTQLGDLAFKDELASGMLMGIPVIHGPTLPLHRLVMIDAAYVGFGLDTPRFDMSSEATLVMLNADDTAPSMAGAQADGDMTGATEGIVEVDEGPWVSNAAAASANARNLFQSYSRALRLVQFAGWSPLMDGAVQTIQTTTWTT